MIIRADKDTKQICLQVRRNNGEACCEDYTLTIEQVLCWEPPKYQYCYTPCAVEKVEIPSEQPLTLVYDIYNRELDGRLCFLLDDKFAELPCGRYVAKLSMCGCEVFTFNIDKKESASVSQVSADGVSNCCEGKYGC